MDKHLKNIRNAIRKRPHYSHGTVSLEGRTTLFYMVDKEAQTSRYLNLAHASLEDVKLLNGACLPATFGRDQEDVLDENYRKAGKMDNSDFMTDFNLENLRIVDRVREQLLDAKQRKKCVKAELYKLNVYGEGSFFKSHKDTPKSETMFGSLVIVFPTTHVGGGLVLRHHRTEWTFDSSALVQGHEKPSIAYVAFFSDVEHEVLPVESGYRVTLTYNLYFDVPSDELPPLHDVQPVAPSQRKLKAAISAALKDPAFLPSGGYLGFGLSFMYPLKTEDSGSIRISDIESLSGMLKGSDSLIMSVCQDLGLEPQLTGVYTDHSRGIFRGVPIIVPEMIPEIDVDCNYDMHEILREECNGKYLLKPGEKPPMPHIPEEGCCMKVVWVTPMTSHTAVEVEYMAYGNEVTKGYMYVNACIIVYARPPRSAKRTTSSSKPDAIISE